MSNKSVFCDVASLLLFIALFLFSIVSNATAQATYVQPNHLVIVINNADPSSEFIADYYQNTYDIPAENIVRVTLNPEKSQLSPKAFDALKIKVEAELLSHHSAVLFLWSAPYQVGCQSITSAFTLGLDPNICQKTCAPSQVNPYYNKTSHASLKQIPVRLSMLLPTQDIDVAMKVIDNGHQSNQGVFKSSAYYLKTPDKARNSRAHLFPKNGLSFRGSGLTVVNQKAEALIDKHDIMIYQTGATHVKHLPTLRFLPGALADHLTSFGGKLEGAGQMSVMEWLRAGATASYGTVSEPCNYWQKFPNPSVLLRWYVAGNTAIEAYWKSVAWPSQGLFVGDPLARPFGALYQN